MIITDMHVHSTFSIDAHDDIDTMCRTAIQKGVKYICFNEHHDLKPHESCYSLLDYEQYSRAIEEAREKFGQELKILKGVEFGDPNYFPGELEKMLEKDFDMVMAGVHFVDDFIMGDRRLKKLYSEERIYEKYYENVLKSVEIGGFDVLAHLDFPKRYLDEIYEFPEMIEEILQVLVKKNIALEINSSPLRKGLDEASPKPDVVESFIKIGGNRVTIGSDAHREADIAANFSQLPELYEKVPMGYFQDRKFQAL